MTSLASIRRDILQKYGALDNPEFHFVQASLDARDYDDLINAIKKVLDVEDDTDPNDDVSFGLIMREQNRRLVLRLSMVGRYALLLRSRDDGSYDVVDPSSAASSEERALARLLQNFNVELLDQATLMQHVPLTLYNTSAEDCRVYQALFTDDDVLPWQ